LKEKQVPSGLVIRQAEKRDIDSVKEIIDLSFPRFFRFFASNSVDSEEGKTLVAEEGAVIAGFAKLIDFDVAGKKFGCVLWFAVHPKHRREGVASALVGASVGDLRNRGAESVFA
jgi:predicted N-acetyltransferase YhbS